MSDIMSLFSQRAIAERAARAEARNTNQTVSKTVVSNPQANNINANPVASLAASGTEYQALESPFSPDAYVATAGSEFFEGGEFDTSTAAPVVFPADLNQTQSTWMEIWSYKRTGTAVGSKNADTNFTAEPAVPGVSHICLPIFTGAGTAYGASWSEGEVTMANQLVTNAVGSGYDSAMETMKRQEASGFGERGRGGGGQNMGEVIASATSGVIDGLSKGISAKAAGGAVLKTVGDLVGTGLQQAVGKAAFNDVIVHYSGPQFRTFEMNFSLKPLSQQDQGAIFSIVRFLKLGQAPTLLDTGGIGRLYELPLFFKIKYMGRSGELTHMNKIGFCALQGLNVKYGGDRFQTFAEDDAPVQTDISMSFREVQLINKDQLKKGY
jgi:hypothetical protein